MSDYSSDSESETQEIDPDAPFVLRKEQTPAPNDTGIPLDLSELETTLKKNGDKDDVGDSISPGFLPPTPPAGIAPSNIGVHSPFARRVHLPPSPGTPPRFSQWELESIENSRK